MEPFVPSPSPRYRATLAVLRAADALWNTSHSFFAQWQLSPSQFNVLNLLGGLPDGSTQTELSQALIMHRSNVTGLVDRLERRNLVRRHPVPGDRRAHRVALTPEGRRLLAEILPPFHAANEKVWCGIPVPELKSLSRALDRLAHNALTGASSP